MESLTLDGQVLQSAGQQELKTFFLLLIHHKATGTYHMTKTATAVVGQKAVHVLWIIGKWQAYRLNGRLTVIKMWDVV